MNEKNAQEIESLNSNILSADEVSAEDLEQASGGGCGIHIVINDDGSSDS